MSDRADSLDPRHVNVIVTDPDESSPAEYNTAQPAVVMDYQNGEDAVAEAARGDGMSLKQRAVRSSMWTLTAFAAGQVIRFISNPILAGLLVPEDFGVVRIVAIFVTALAAISDVGIEQSIIQNKRGDDPTFLNTAWTIHAARGIALWLGACAITYPVYWIYRNPAAGAQDTALHLLWLLPIAGLAPLVAGFNSTAVFTLNRHLQMGKLTIVNLVFQIVSVAVTIGLAIKWRSPMTFVLGGLAANIFYLAASHHLLKGYRNRFCWDPEVRKELMRFGKWIMISTLITYAANQIDQLLLGKLLDMKWLGLYAIALGLVSLPREVIGRLASVTLFPALARAAEMNPADLGRVLLRARGLILTVTLATMLGVVLGAPLFIMLFFKPEYHPAGWLAQLAAIAAWITLLQVSADRALLALGKTKPLAVSNGVNLVITVVGAMAGRWIDLLLYPGGSGINGFVLGLSVGKLAGHFIVQVEMARSGISIFRQDAMFTAAALGLSVAGILLPRAFPAYGPGHIVLYNGMVAVVLCGATCVWAGLKVLRGIR